MNGCTGQVSPGSVDLDASPASVPEARQFCRDVLAGRCSDAVLDMVELCASELVTNAVLHARTAVRLSVELTDSAVRIQVQDSSPVSPQRVPHSRSAATGRGLGLVSSLCEEWGSYPLPGIGKVVWCDVGLRGYPEPQNSWGDWDRDIAELLGGAEARAVAASNVDVDAGAGDSSVSGPTPVVLVTLLGYPVRLGVRQQEHFEALRRECQLISLSDPTERSRTPKRLVEMAAVLHQRRAELADPERRKLEAYLRGQDTVDLEYWVSSLEGAAMVRAWQDLLLEMDEYCRQEYLLTLEAPVEAAALRRWVLEEFLSQIEGRPPRPWPGPLD